MKKFLKGLLTFLLVFIAIRIIILVCLPYPWGNPWFSAKIRYMKKENIKPEMVFMGSSRVYRQIDPALYDSLARASGKGDLNSFNLGAPATFPPQTYYLLEHYLHSGLASGTKYLILEIEDILPLGNRHQERTSYWIQPKYLWMVLKSTLQRRDLKPMGKAKIIGGYLEASAERIFGLGHFRSEIKEPDYYDPIYVGPNKDGFLPLDKDYKLQQREGFQERLNKIEPEVIKKRFQNAMTALPNQKSLDKVHLDYLKKMIAQIKQRNIKVFLLIPPRNVNSYILRFAHELAADCKILDLSKNADYYNPLFSFDNGHLNQRGANEFTKELFEKSSEYLNP